MMKYKILQNALSIGKSSYGIGQISVNLALAQQMIGHNVHIWSLDNGEDIGWASETHGFPARHINGFKIMWPKKLLFSYELIQYIRNIDNNNYDIVHQHGIWGGNSIATLMLANKFKTPTVIAPHGSLDEWALHTSKVKKKIALALYEQKNLMQASCLHATSENEISNFRDFGLKNPIAYIENGIQAKSLTIQGNKERFLNSNKLPNDKRILLYLSRITPKKGIPMLLNAIKSIENYFADWHLVIVGNDEFGHQKEVENQIANLCLKNCVSIIGPQFNEAKYDAFEAADLFILPSYSEGSPMVILDSLAAGVPVITTCASSWDDLNTYNCGWWTRIDQTEITNALKSAVIKPKAELNKMGENAVHLMQSKYLWSKIAQKTIDLYAWLTNNGGKPDFVQTN